MDNGHHNIDRQDPSDEEPVSKRPRLNDETDVHVTASGAQDTPINLGSGHESSSRDPPVPIFSREEILRDREQWLRETENIRKLNSLELAPEIVAYLGLAKYGDPQLFLAWNLGIQYLALDPKDPLTSPGMLGVSDDNFWDLVDYGPLDDGTFNRVRGMDRLRWFFWRLLFFDMHEWFTSHGIVENVESVMLAVLPPKGWAFPVDEIRRRYEQGRNLDELCQRFGHGCLFYLQKGLVCDALDDLVLKTDNWQASIVCLENWGLGTRSADLKVEELAKKVRKHLLYQRVEATGTDDEE